ncbi:MAG: hypothetical protein ACK44A_04925 [Roseateles sp.]
MSGLQHNAQAVARRYRSAASAVAQHLRAELYSLAAEITTRMKLEAPKDLTTLTNSITAEPEGPLQLFIGPRTAYALWVARGRKPGKGLPRFAQGLPAVEWLRRRLVDAARAANPKFRKARSGSARAQAFEAELETRYLAWSRAVRARGIKPNPYVKRTADAFRQAVPDRLAAAVQRGVRAYNAQRAA